MSSSKEAALFALYLFCMAGIVSTQTSESESLQLVAWYLAVARFLLLLLFFVNITVLCIQSWDERYNVAINYIKLVLVKFTLRLVIRLAACCEFDVNYTPCMHASILHLLTLQCCAFHFQLSIGH